MKRKAYCEYHMCEKEGMVSQCPYCKSWFCDKHLPPHVPYIFDIFNPRDMNERIEAEEQKDPHWHPCPEYYHIDKEKKTKETEDYIRALDIISGRRPYGVFHPDIEVPSTKIEFRIKKGKARNVFNKVFKATEELSNELWNGKRPKWVGITRYEGNVEVDVYGWDVYKLTAKYYIQPINQQLKQKEKLTDHEFEYMLGLLTNVFQIYAAQKDEVFLEYFQELDLIFKVSYFTEQAKIYVQIAENQRLLIPQPSLPPEPIKLEKQLPPATTTPPPEVSSPSPIYHKCLSCGEQISRDRNYCDECLTKQRESQPKPNR